MSRILRAFERRYRELLAELHARERDKGVRWLIARAGSHAPNTTFSQALAEANVVLAEKVHRFRKRQRPASQAPQSLLCDAGLGGLCRWLRAAGCDARWMQDVEDADLVAEAERTGAIVITTDSLLLDRRPIVQGKVRAIWVPPTLRKLEQLRLVRAELDLPKADSRCMRCGGELVEVDKEAVRDRVPPKTYLWVDEYFECARCKQLFWHGTHWRQIMRRL